MLELLVNQILREILDEIRENGIFSVMSDETSDQNRQQQLVILVRHVGRNFEIEESLFGLYYYYYYYYYIFKWKSEWKEDMQTNINHVKWLSLHN